jgi:hypothetical protein
MDLVKPYLHDLCMSMWVLTYFLLQPRIPKIHQDNKQLVMGFCNVALWNPQYELKTMRFLEYQFYFYFGSRLLQKKI